MYALSVATIYKVQSQYQYRPLGAKPAHSNNPTRSPNSKPSMSIQTGLSWGGVRRGFWGVVVHVYTYMYMYMQKAKSRTDVCCTDGRWE